VCIPLRVTTEKVELAMIRHTSYKAKQFNLNGLKGISDQTLELHFKLYEGYVNETNKLNENIVQGRLRQEQKAVPTGSL
jgi:Fe-Mn family superoxide dismutase